MSTTALNTVQPPVSPVHAPGGDTAPFGRHGIVVTGLTRANRIKSRGFAAVISISDPNGARLAFYTKPRPAHFLMRFDDIDAPQGAWRGPDAAQIADGLAFARANPGPLLIHCQAGVCRSPAMALAVLADRLGPGREDEAVAAMFEVAPDAVANLMVVAHADAALGRAGALRAALERRESGSERYAAFRRKKAQDLERYWHNPANRP